ncbi:DUF4397 domain-containing protein [Persicimonas caeni]|nr:DUF4397 domain-containing protein [Persicimonas caeni]
MNHTLRTTARLLAGLLMAFVVSWIAAGCGQPVTYCAPGDPNCEAGCVGGCGAGEYCANGQCVSIELQCNQAGEECNPRAQSSDGFLCIDWDGQGVREAMCSQMCSPDATCPAGSSCFVLSSNFDTPCQSASDCREDMLCIQGTCRYTACQPSECTGFLSGQQACAQKYADHPNFADGAKCYEFENQSNYCFPAGQRQLGEACVDINTALQQQEFTATCAAGLGCVSGTCRTPCESDEDCDGEDTCTLSAATNLGTGVGFCANTCTPFEEGACGPGKMCQPVGPDEGHCVPTGTKPAFSQCVPGENECEMGTLCVEYDTPGGQTEARCHPICDLTAAPPGADGTVSDSAQAARDATCPQPPAALASVRLVHLSELAGPVDVYVAGEDDVLVEGLDFGGVHPAPSSASWLEMEPGRYRLTAVPAGAPRTDRPLVDVTVDLASGVGEEIYIAPPAPTSSDDAQSVVIEAHGADVRTSQTELRVVHLLSDTDAVDVVVVDAADDAAELSNQIVLAEDLAFGQGGALVSVPAEELRVLVFASGADRTDTSAALVNATITASADSTAVLRGTLDPDDFYDASQPTVLELGDAPDAAPRGTQFSCTALDNGAYGFCQQVCSGGASDFGTGACEGDAMGCTPTQYPARAEWLTLCAPVGDGGSGTSCDPQRPNGQCQEGLFCMPYGTGVEPSDDGLLGRCTPLCEVDGSGTSALGCEEGQSCKPVAYDGSYDIGQCGWSCDAGADYADDRCPAGLKSCKPTASLREDASGQTAPVVQDEQPFCSASGPVAAGETCGGRDCVAGTECIYPRSEQTDLVSTLLPQYFGASGLVPTCTPQCDPFDADSSEITCASGETCLPNYPWSAEVGHCAPIDTWVAPNQPCDNPGLACGEDSICVIYQGGQDCLRFCDYEGADAQGAYAQSTCPPGLVCEPFVADIGVCGAP